MAKKPAQFKLSQDVLARLTAYQLHLSVAEERPISRSEVVERALWALIGNADNGR